MIVPPIIALGVVNFQWSKVFALASLIIISSSLISISASNLPEIFVQSLPIASVTFAFSDYWKSWPRAQVHSSHLELIWISSLLSVVMMWSIVLM